MTRAHEGVVADQFGPRAMAYFESAVHGRGEDLDAIEAIALRAAPKHALDLGCGGGHVAYRLAKHAKGVTASDLSAQMLEAVAAAAHSKGLTNIETTVASAEQLPFQDSAFDFLGCRYSAHHWCNFECGLREARRVMEAGAQAVFVDVYSAGGPLIDTHLQAVELLRDTSHVRDYTAAEWLSALTRTDFQIRATRTWRVRMDFNTWISRMRTPEINVQAIRSLQTAASADVRAHFAIEPDGSFMLDVLLVEAVAA